MAESNTRRRAGHGEYDPHKISGLRFLKKMHGAERLTAERVAELKAKNFNAKSFGKIADDPQLEIELK